MTRHVARQVLASLVTVAAIVAVVLLVVWQRPRPSPSPGAAASAVAAPAAATAVAPRLGTATDAGAPAPDVPLDARREPSVIATAAPGLEPGRPNTLAAVVRFKDAQVPVAQRRGEIMELARRGDRESVAVLMALGDEHTYLNWAAVAALGQVSGTNVVPYLTGKLGDQEIAVACAAVRAIGQALGSRAIPVLAATLAQTRSRRDGYEDHVWQACAETLGSIRSPDALPLLDRELSWVAARQTRHLEYGSQLVAACRQIGAAAGAEMLARYAARLEAQQPAEARVRLYVNEKIAEARQTAAALRRP